MRCQDFLEAYSAFRDGYVDPVSATDLDAHRRNCSDCDRYARVLDRSLALLHDLPQPSLSESFEPRLEHRLLHVQEDLRALRTRGVASGTTAATALLMAILLSAIAWSAGAGAGVPSVAMPAIVASPPARAALTSIPVVVDPVRTVRLVPTARFSSDLWSARPIRLYEYSPLRTRYTTSRLQGSLVD